MKPRKPSKDFIKVVKKSRAYVITEPTALPVGVEPQILPTMTAEAVKPRRDAKPKKNNNDFNKFGGGGSWV
jgi:hypothetical protein